MTDALTVGIDGSSGALAATRWAAREADRRGLRLRLVHVLNVYLAVGGFTAAPYPTGGFDDRRIAEQILRDATREATTVLSADRVDTLMLRGDRRVGLLQVAATSAMLVLGDEPHPFLDRIITGTIVASVAAHAPVPVVVVPANWAGDTQSTTQSTIQSTIQGGGADRGVVVAGVKSVASAADVARQAAEIAASRGARLVLVHAWSQPVSYEGVLVVQQDLAEWQERIRDELTELAGTLASDFPGVEIEVRVIRGHAASVLTAASAEADLLVLLRRPRGFPFGHLGATGRAVLRETRCPAVVLPPSVADEERIDPASDS